MKLQFYSQIKKLKKIKKNKTWVVFSRSPPKSAFEGSQTNPKDNSVMILLEIHTIGIFELILKSQRFICYKIYQTI